MASGTLTLFGGQSRAAESLTEAIPEPLQSELVAPLEFAQATGGVRREMKLGELFVGSGVKFNGYVQSTGRLVVEGEVEGEIDVDELIVSVGGYVGGAVRARRVAVHGRVEASVVTTEMVSVSHTAYLRGDVAYGEAFAVCRGARVDGNVGPALRAQPKKVEPSEALVDGRSGRIEACGQSRQSLFGRVLGSIGPF